MRQPRPAASLHSAVPSHHTLQRNLLEVGSLCSPCLCPKPFQSCPQLAGGQPDPQPATQTLHAWSPHTLPTLTLAPSAPVLTGGAESTWTLHVHAETFRKVAKVCESSERWEREKPFSSGLCWGPQGLGGPLRCSCHSHTAGSPSLQLWHLQGHHQGPGGGTWASFPTCGDQLRDHVPVWHHACPQSRAPPMSSLTCEVLPGLSSQGRLAPSVWSVWTEGPSGKHREGGLHGSGFWLQHELLCRIQLDMPPSTSLDNTVVTMVTAHLGFYRPVILHSQGGAGTVQATMES